MRIGVFGGTFDPIHQGHLIVAEQCREQAGLDQVWFIPAARPPHKQGKPVTPFAQRVEMLALGIAGNPTFRIDELEKDRRHKPVSPTCFVAARLVPALTIETRNLRQTR